jgi:hypothetical protein
VVLPFALSHEGNVASSRSEGCNVF